MYTKEGELEILRLSDVPLQEVRWLWYPYIPFGKITIIQGDPGGGKTTLALRLAAACTTGRLLSLCLLSSGRWGSNAPSACNPKVGQIFEKYDKPSAGRVFPDFSLGQAERPAVRRRFAPTLKGEPGGSPDPL